MSGHIAFVSGGYPYGDDPSYAFVKALVKEIAGLGVECTVISPQSYARVYSGKARVRPKKWQHDAPNAGGVQIIQPMYLSCSNVTLAGGYSVSQFFFEKAVRKALFELESRPDVLYGHFWHSGICAARASDYDIPVVVAAGESKIWADRLYPKRAIQRALPKIKGAICVSGKSLVESNEKGFLGNGNKPAIVVPNGVDLKIFKPQDKSFCRKKLGIAEDEFVVVYVGALSERKGIERLAEACRGAQDIRLLTLGTGPKEVRGDNITLVGKVAHEKIPEYLSAADIFALPTLAEGCCNAIVEAMACGLPIVSSDLDFNHDILNTSNSILVNPLNIEEIANAVSLLRQDEALRKRLSLGALETARGLALPIRAARIINFIEETCEVDFQS